MARKKKAEHMRKTDDKNEVPSPEILKVGLDKESGEETKSKHDLRWMEHTNVKQSEFRSFDMTFILKRTS